MTRSGSKDPGATQQKKVHKPERKREKKEKTKEMKILEKPLFYSEQLAVG